MRVVMVVDALDAVRPVLPAAAAAAAIVAGWRVVAPDDELLVVPPDPTAVGRALDQAELAVVGVSACDWSVLRDSLVTAVAGAAQERGLPCLVLAGAVSVGRREAGAIGVDAAYAVDPPGALTPEALAALAERVARRWSRRPTISGG